jgi:hypothetical protein
MVDIIVVWNFDTYVVVGDEGRDERERNKKLHSTHWECHSTQVHVIV